MIKANFKECCNFWDEAQRFFSLNQANSMCVTCVDCVRLSPEFGSRRGKTGRQVPALHGRIRQPCPRALRCGLKAKIRRRSRIKCDTNKSEASEHTCTDEKDTRTTVQSRIIPANRILMIRLEMHRNDF